jgi:hypothetical protein
LTHRLLIGAVASLALVAVGCSDSPSSSSEDPETAEATHVAPSGETGRLPLVGVMNGPRVTWSMQGGTLVRVDPRTFCPLRGYRLELGRHGYSWSYSPDRSKLVLGGFASGLRFVDVNRFRRLGDLREKRRDGLVLAVAWPKPSRVLAIVQDPLGGGPLRLATVDPVKRTVVEWRSVSGRAVVVSALSNKLGLLVLLAPPAGIGPTKLLFIDAHGTAHTTVLDRVWAGQESVQSGAAHRVVRSWVPGLTVDLAGQRAFVVGGATPVVEIDLRTMRAADHELREPISLLQQLRRWLEPTAQAKGETEGQVRVVRWRSGGLLGVSGFDARGERPSKARGLRLIDTRTWAVRALDRKAADFVSTQGLLLAYGCCDRTGDESLGVTAYDRRGRKVWHLFGRRPVHAVQVSGSRAYVRIDGTWRPEGPLVAVVDPRRGKVLSTLWTPWIQLLLPQEASMAEKEG